MSNQRSRELRPCGTPAAARRHYRHGEPLDPQCAAAQRQHERDRAGTDPYAVQEPEPQGQARNGLTERPYIYGAARPTWALEAIRAAEAKYGRPSAELDTDRDWEAA